MEGYDGWHDEDDPTAPEVEALPRRAPSTARKSLIVFDDDHDKHAAAAAALGGAPQSRIFPGQPIAPPRATRNLENLKEPVYRAESRWPYALVALLVLLGAFAMFVIGIVCVRDFYTAETGGPNEPALGVQLCGPAGGSGGIVMIIAGCFAMIAAGYQLWRLREPVLKLAGYKPAGPQAV